MSSTHQQAGVNQLIKVARLVEQSLAACEAALPKINQESHLRVMHMLIATHRAHRESLVAATNQDQPNMQTAAEAVLARGSVALGGLMGTSQVWEVVYKQQKSVAEAYSQCLAAMQFAPALQAEISKQSEAVVADLAEIDSLLHGNSQAQSQRDTDQDEITRGRAMPRVDAQAARLNNSVDY